ncbi:MFS transporter [Actinosynnema sp. NPDC023794]
MSWPTSRRGEFLPQLDGTIVTAALPSLRADLGVDVAATPWVLNAFFVAFGGLLPPAGRLGDVLGHRRVFLAGIGLVTVASLVAGLAPTFDVLVVGRVLQGAGAAIAGPTGLALLAVLFRGERQARAFGAALHRDRARRGLGQGPRRSAQVGR